MALSPAERLFLDNLQKKLDKYQIKKDGKLLTARDCLKYSRNQFVMAHYNDDSPDELIEVGIEIFLYRCCPLLFIEKYGTFTLPGQGTMSCKNLYYFQKEILKDFTKWNKIVLTKSRQVGLSTLTSLIFWWKACLFPNQWLNIISKDRKASQEFLSKVKENFKNLPSWIGLKFLKNNAESVEFSNHSKIYAYARGKNAGRGDSPTMVVLDEAAFYGTRSLIEGIVSSVQASLTKTGGTLIVISTPNGSAEGGEGRWYYEQVRDLQECGGIDGISRLYDIGWWEVPDFPGIAPYKGYNDKLQEYIDRDYFNNPAVRKEANDYFMPIARKEWEGNEWLKFQMKTLGKIKYLQEILQNFNVTGSTVFSEDILEQVYNETKLPLSEDMLLDRPLKNLWIWKRPVLDHKYLLTIDVAKGSGDDSSCIQVVDMNTIEQVAEYSGKCTTIDLAKYAYKIGEYYNWAYNITECNSIGEATFNELYYNLNYPNLFTQNKNRNGLEVKTGWITTAKTRELITSNFIDFYYDKEMKSKYHPYSERLLSQMKYWVWKGGRPDHDGGAHDDNIMAMAIALYNISDAVKQIRTPEDVVFWDPSGTAIKLQGQTSEGELTKEYFSSREDKGRTLDESTYKEMEKEMYRKAGLNADDPNAANDLRWLLS